MGPITAGAATISLGGGSSSDATATNVTLGGTTTFFAQILGTGLSDYSRLTVTGTLNLGGAALAIYMPGPFFSSTGQSFMIINKSGAGAVTGTFNGLPEGGTLTIGGRTLQISYIAGDGNDVVLTDIGAQGAGTAIPALGLAGLAAFAALLLGLGLVALRRA